MRPFALVVWVFIVFAVRPLAAFAQDFGFEPPTDAAHPELPEALRDLAARVLPVYREGVRDQYLANLSVLQMAVGDPTAARATRASLRERQQVEGAPPAGRAVVYDIYTEARAAERDDVPFAAAYAEAFRATLGRMSDLRAYELEPWLAAPVEPLRAAFQRELDERVGKNVITLEEALELLRAWFAFEAYRSADGLVQPLIAEDIERRYMIDEGVEIPVAQNVTVTATVVRPRSAADAGIRTALLEFTLDPTSRDPREAAAHGYASVLAVARIADEPGSRPRAPFESDGDDARAVIAWIVSQPWSDGRVGMQGTGYGGFVAWSAAKNAPAALQAIATSNPTAPGIDMPTSGRIFLNSSYRWVYSLLAPANDTRADDDAFWRELDEEWFRSGRRYREFPSLPIRASAIFRGWLNHPSYDRFWQKWVPFEEEFASIHIPVLTITGYYSPAQPAALYYFAEHHAHDPEANHTLLAGSFDEPSMGRRAAGAALEVPMDSAARPDLNDVRYAWLDYALHGAERPERLAATVNFELGGVGEWRHAPALDALGEALRLYLEASPVGPPNALVPGPPPAPMALAQSLDLGNRDDADWRPAEALAVTELSPRDGTVFMTAPFGAPVDVAGRLRGVLDLTVNKQDVDLVLQLYELRLDGTYVKLFDPAYAFRASYARDRVRRRLLVAGVRQQIPFESERMLGRRLETGSRLVLTVAINKRADQQINYGAGNDVSEESIDDAGAPVRIRWHEGSYIELAELRSEDAAAQE